MKNSFGSQVTITIFGESHGPSVGVVLDGLSSGIDVDLNEIKKMLDLRKPIESFGATTRCEKDKVIIESGVFNGKTTGTPIMIRINNNDVISDDYNKIIDSPRPGHADYTNNCKYRGYNNPFGGGHSSGRITVGLVAAGGIIIPALKKKGIDIISRISSINNITDNSEADLINMKKIESEKFPVIDSLKSKEFLDIILSAKHTGDSVGGILETHVFGIPVGIGEPWFDTIEGLISHAIFSIPGVKAIEFGAGFDITKKYGSQSNDCYELNDNKITCSSNNNGGILGGITNGMPIVFRTGIKPTPSINKEQMTMNIHTRKIEPLMISGRHDACIVPRVRAVIDSMTALVLADMLSIHFGTDWLAK